MLSLNVSGEQTGVQESPVVGRVPRGGSESLFSLEVLTTGLDSKRGG